MNDQRPGQVSECCCSTCLASRECRAEQPTLNHGNDPRCYAAGCNRVKLMLVQCGGSPGHGYAGSIPAGLIGSVGLVPKLRERPTQHAAVSKGILLNRFLCRVPEFLTT